MSATERDDEAIRLATVLSVDPTGVVLLVGDDRRVVEWSSLRRAAALPWTLRPHYARLLNEATAMASTHSTRPLATPPASAEHRPMVRATARPLAEYQQAHAATEAVFTEARKQVPPWAPRARPAVDLHVPESPTPRDAAAQVEADAAVIFAEARR